MANLFGTEFETPEETQRRLLEEQRLRGQQFTGDTNAQIGYNLTNALSNIFGKNRELQMSQKRADGVAKSQTAAEAIIKEREEELGKQLTDHEKRMIRSAEAASVMSKLGGAENLAAASQIRAQMLADNAAEKERQRQIESHKAQLKATEAATAVNERNVFEQQSRGELEHRITKIAEMPDGPTKEKLMKQYQGQLTEVVRDEERQAAADRRAEENLELNKRTQDWREQEIPPQILTMQRNYTEEYFADTGEARAILGVANQLEQLQASGKAAEGLEYLKKQFGTEDVASALRAQAQSIIVKEAIQNLPPGVASDKDIELVMSGTMPNTSNPQQLEQYLRGLAKLRQLDASYKRFTAEYISENRNLDGLITAWSESGIQNSYSSVAQEYASAGARAEMQGQPNPAETRQAERLQQESSVQSIIDGLDSTND